MHYVTKVITQKYPDVAGFMADIMSIEKASQVSLQSVEQDVLSLERTASLVSAELESDATNKTLIDFSRNVSPKYVAPLAYFIPRHLLAHAHTCSHAPFSLEKRVQAVRKDLNQAKALYQKATTYFAEEVTTEPGSFFSIFVRLDTAIQAAKEQNRVREEQARQEAERLAKLMAKTKIAEAPEAAAPVASTSTGSSTEIRKGPEVRLEVQDGVIDDIISEMKVNAFRRPGLPREKREVGQSDGFTSYSASRPWLK